MPTARPGLGWAAAKTIFSQGESEMRMPHGKHLLPSPAAALEVSGPAGQLWSAPPTRGRPGEGASAFRPPRPCVGSGKREEACGISSPLVAAAGSVTRTGVAATVVWMHTQSGGDARPSG